LHPDVISAKRTLARLEEERTREIAVRRRAMANRPEVAIVGNPIAQQLKVALNEATQQVTTAKARVAEFESRYARLKASAEQLPQIDTELTQLNRDYEIQRNQY